MPYFVYIVRCSDKSLYTGSTNDLKKRIDVHNQGKGAKYTRTRLPVELVYYEELENVSEALKREHEIKQYSKKDKEGLVNESEFEF